ncbi:MAG: hypothetical protein AAF703_07935 [Cyanobacteria bacterium P01_D01_bin.105]
MIMLSNAQRIALYNQHSLTSADWQLICQLANVENISEKQSQQLASLNFEQFFGLAIHSFISTQHYFNRQQLADLLPKFGSRAVLSLFKILFHCKSGVTSAGIVNSHELIALTQSSLKKVEPAAFVVGLETVLSDKSATALMPLVVDVVVSSIREDDGTLLALLPRLLSAESWQQLKAALLEFPVFFAIQANIQAQQRKDALRQAMVNINAGVITNASLDYLSCQLVDAPAVTSSV